MLRSENVHGGADALVRPVGVDGAGGFLWRCSPDEGVRGSTSKSQEKWLINPSS
jgi:hypothetical protein